MRTRRSGILRRYARLNPDGVPIVCPFTRGRNGPKVIFDTEEQADAAAVELGRLTSDSMTTHPCLSGGHFHLSTRGS